MPTEIKAFACRFKCRKHITASKATMVKHETRCGKNPGNRACPTCKHDDFDKTDTGIYRFCEIEKRPDEIRVIYMCESWEMRDGITDDGHDAAQEKHSDVFLSSDDSIF